MVLKIIRNFNEHQMTVIVKFEVINELLTMYHY